MADILSALNQLAVNIPLRQVTCILENDTIKGLPNNSIVIVPPIGGNKIIIPLISIFTSNLVDAYTNISGYCVLYLCGELGEGISTNLIGGGAYLNNLTANTTTIITARQTVPDQTGDFNGSLLDNPLPNPISRNNTLLLAADSDDGNDFGGGHVNNKIRVTTLYVIFNFDTGLFE